MIKCGRGAHKPSRPHKKAGMARRQDVQYSFYAFISRMKNINRWALMRNSSAENIQEHSHMVAVLAHGLAVIGRDIFGKKTDPDKAASAALFHDATEIITGDMPTPVKYYSRSINLAYKEVERLAAENLLATLPDEMRPEYEKLVRGYDGDTGRYVKAADTLAAYIKCVEELRAGNNEFALAARQTREKLEKMDMEEIRYFMQHFMQPFELTLDELNSNNTML